MSQPRKSKALETGIETWFLKEGERKELPVENNVHGDVVVEIEIRQQFRSEEEVLRLRPALGAAEDLAHHRAFVLFVHACVESVWRT